MAFTEIVGTNKFAQGMMKYVDNYPGHFNNRIVVPISIEGQIITTAMLDTGSVWCILRAEEVEDLPIDYYEEDVERSIGEFRWRGKMCRLQIGIEAQIGEPISVDATVFVPDPVLGKQPLPNLIGFSGFLERIRFAIDPEHNHFYFAPLGS
jgi:hypothetical protein